MALSPGGPILTRVGVELLGVAWMRVGVPGRVFGATRTYLGPVGDGTPAVGVVRGTDMIVGGLEMVWMTLWGCWESK